MRAPLAPAAAQGPSSNSLCGWDCTASTQCPGTKDVRNQSCSSFQPHTQEFQGPKLPISLESPGSKSIKLFKNPSECSSENSLDFSNGEFPVIGHCFQISRGSYIFGSHSVEKIHALAPIHPFRFCTRERPFGNYRFPRF